MPLYHENNHYIGLTEPTRFSRSETWPADSTASHLVRPACDRIKEENTAVVEFVQSLDVQLAEAFSLADAALTFLWWQRTFSIFTEEEPADRTLLLGLFNHYVNQGYTEEGQYEDLLAIVHYRFEVIWKV